MQSSLTNIDEYMQTAPKYRLDCLSKLRQLCITHLKKYTETMEYGMPSYSKNGIIEVAFNSQKTISLYIFSKKCIR